jgi:hypothetical protein
MEISNDATGLDFARLDRRKGRPVRSKLASARVTTDEQKELDSAALADGKLFGEWAREVLLREARSPRADALFTEIVATRMLLNLVLKPLACGEVVTAEEFSGVLTHVRTTKHKAAADVIEQYATAVEKER